MLEIIFRKRLEMPRSPAELRWAPRPASRWLPVVCFWLGICTPLPTPAAPCENIIVLSDFASGADGWTAVVDKTGVPRAVSHVSGVTPSDSSIRVSELEEDGASIYFVAPGKFLGNQSAALGGRLRFRFQQTRTVEIIPGPDIVLESGGVRIVHNYATVPRPVWTTYEVPLVESAWKHSNGTPLASQAELAAVLANITLLWIRAEYSARPADRADLGNVQWLAAGAAAAPPALQISQSTNTRIEIAWPSTYRLDLWTLWMAQGINGPWQPVPNPDDIVSRDGFLHYEALTIPRIRFFQLRSVPCE